MRWYNKGQAAIEYVMMLAVVMVMIVAIMGKVRDYMVANAASCTPTSKSVICNLKRALGTGNNFRYFKLID